MNKRSLFQKIMAISEISYSFIATLLWVSGKYSWTRFSDPLKKALKEADLHFKGKGLPFPVSRIETIFEGYACSNRIEIFREAEKFYDSKSLATSLLDFENRSLKNVPKNLEIAINFVEYFKSTFKKKIYSNPRYAHQALGELLEINLELTKENQNHVIEEVKLILDSLDDLPQISEWTRITKECVIRIDKELKTNIYGNQKIVNRLLKELDAKDIALADRDAEIEKWIKRYHELREEVRKRSADDRFIEKANKFIKEGNLEGAESIFIQSMEMHLLKMQKEKQVAAQNAFQLGKIKALQFDYKKSGFYYRKAVELDPEDSIYLNHFGDLLYTMGEYEAAQNNFKNALEVDTKKWGDMHPRVADSLSSLGLVMLKNGDYHLAKQYLKKALKIRIKVLGRFHAETAISYDNIGNLYVKIGKYKIAFHYLDVALNIKVELYGQKHLKVAVNMGNLAELFRLMGDFDKALYFHYKALEIRLKELGEWHLETANSYKGVGYLNLVMGHFTVAELYLEKTLEINTKLLGKEHPEIATGFNNIGGLLEEIGNFDSAKNYFEKALKIRKTIFGEEHPDTASCYNNLGTVLIRMGQFKLAKVNLEKAFEINKKTLGEQHPHQTHTLHNLAVVYFQEGDYNNAAKKANQAIRMSEKLLGKNHPDTILTKRHLTLIQKKTYSLA